MAKEMLSKTSKKITSLDARLRKLLLYWSDRIGYKKWRNYPLGRTRNEKKVYDDRFELAKTYQNIEVDNFENANGQKINGSFLEDLAYNIQISNKESFPDFSHGRVLYSALAEYLFNQSDLSSFTIVETGTAKGFSAVCMAKAFEDAGAIGGILTYDVIPHNIEMYWNCVTDHLHGALSRKRLLEKWSDLVDKYVIFVEGDSKLMMNKIHVGRVHFAFLDGGHTYKDVCKEFSWVQEKQFRGDIIICDDYNIVDYPGIVFAVDERCEIGNYRKTVVPLTGNRKLVLCEKL